MKLPHFLSSLRAMALSLAVAAAAVSTMLLSTPAPLAIGAATGLTLLAAPTSSEAAMSLATASRQALCQSIVTAAGSGARKQLYTSTRPSSANVAATGTLLATISFGTTIGTCTGGVLTFDTGGATQTASSHVAGTPGYVRITTSGGTAIYDIDICGAAPCVTFTGNVATGQNITLTGLTLTMPNP
jgi:hypothetical protein